MSLQGEVLERSADDRGRISLPKSKAANKRFKIKVVEEINYSEEINMEELENWETDDGFSPIFSAYYTEDDLTFIAVHEHSTEDYFYIEGQIKSGEDSVTVVTLPGEHERAEDAVSAAKEWMEKNDQNISKKIEK